MAKPDMGLRRLMLAGVTWLVAGQIVVQVTRFASNLIMTRLLAPSAFGVMGMVQLFMMAAELFSDIGLRQSVIYHSRSNDPRFLNTVWTMQIIRGFLIWLSCCLLAIPLARYYALPDLTWLLPLTGASSIIRGFSSTSLLRASRDINIRSTTFVDVGAALFGSIATVLLSIVLRSVSALALGWLIATVAHLILSYQLNDAHRHRLAWDRTSVRSLVVFGRWSILSGFVVLLYQRGDRLALGRLLSEAELGSYMIGAHLGLLPMMFFAAIQSKLLQPAFSKLRDLNDAENQRKYLRLRLAVVVSHALPLILLGCLGQPIVDLLYPAQLSAAGAYCSIIAFASLLRVVTDVGPIFPARGDSRTHFHISVARTVATVLGMLIGYQLSVIGWIDATPDIGLLLGLTLSPLLSYPYQVYEYRKINAWIPKLDALAIISSVLLMAMTLPR